MLGFIWKKLLYLKIGFIKFTDYETIIRIWFLFYFTLLSN
jgi:hypothetical protein